MVGAVATPRCAAQAFTAHLSAQVTIQAKRSWRKRQRTLRARSGCSRMPKAGFRRGLEREVEIGRKALAVGGTRTGADVAHKIPAGPERKGTLLPAGKKPAIKPGIGLAQGDELLHHLLPISLLIASAEGMGKRRGLTEGRPAPITAMAQLPAAPPGSPAPGIGMA
jgi:hypothetical protein